MVVDASAGTACSGSLLETEKSERWLHSQLMLAGPLPAQPDSLVHKAVHTFGSCRKPAPTCLHRMPPAPGALPGSNRVGLEGARRPPASVGSDQLEQGFGHPELQGIRRTTTDSLAFGTQGHRIDGSQTWAYAEYG